MLFGRKEKIELKVTGMTCGHCELKVKQALGHLPGVKGVSASFAEEKVTIEPDKSGTFDRQEIKEVIASLGYQVVE